MTLPPWTIEELATLRDDVLVAAGRSAEVLALMVVDAVPQSKPVVNAPSVKAAAPSTTAATRPPASVRPPARPPGPGQRSVWKIAAFAALLIGPMLLFADPQRAELARDWLTRTAPFLPGIRQPTVAATEPEPPAAEPAVTWSPQTQPNSSTLVAQTPGSWLTTAAGRRAFELGCCSTEASAERSVDWLIRHLVESTDWPGDAQSAIEAFGETTRVALQLRLQRAGDYKGSIDGKVRTQSLAALRGYVQRIRGQDAFKLNSQAWQAVIEDRSQQGWAAADAALAIAPDDAHILDTRGQIHLDGSRMKEAYVDLQESIERGIDDAGTFYGRGRCLEAKGDTARAIKDYRRAVEPLPTSAYHQRVQRLARERLETLLVTAIPAKQPKAKSSP